MVLLAAQKFSKKLEDHNNHTHHDHHHHHQSHHFSSSLQAFRSIASNSISQLPQSEILSLLWIHKFLGLLPSINRAFAKLLVDIDYPMSSWDSESVQLFLRYSVNLLDLFNSISSCLSHLGQARMSLCHGLSLLENSPSSAMKHLKPIPPGRFNLSFDEDTKAEDREAKDCSGKQMVVHEAVNELKRIVFWVCGIFLSGLCSEWKPYLEMRKITGGFDDSSVFTLDSRINELMLIEKMPVLKEIEEINGSVANLLAASDAEKLDASMELQKELHVLEKLMDDASKEVDELFGNVMTQRNELIDCFRITTTQPQKSTA
ncbi:protein BPS1, chloroplastic-like [Neltuma alba]|uniref:protein BPS1, chloroplastic-like n=1 Tax=Neltuma alba TaxID=207710 RepID=UPI0010A379EA|nr:protein BPS1, chloroplastic-like [Prosopis alba]